MDRGQTFFPMDGAKIFISHMVKARINSLPNPGPELFLKPSSPDLMVVPLFIEEENTKLPPKYSNCVKCVAFRHCS